MIALGIPADGKISEFFHCGIAIHWVMEANCDAATFDSALTKKLPIAIRLMKCCP